MSTLPLGGPKFRALTANATPLAGGKLFSYAAGTTTPLDTFTTRAGTTPNSNPVILNANGEADVWTSPGVLYKFVLKDASDVIQWTVDNVPSGLTDTSSTVPANTIEPGGRLTLTSGVPITTSDVLAATTIFYTPLNHNQVPLYDGTVWTLTTITELSQALSDNTKSPAAVVHDNNYDLFIWNDLGTIRLSRGPPWASRTDRGTGAGTTELSRVSGRWGNANAISNGPAAHRGLYVGTVFAGSDAKIYDSMAFRELWNAYNRVKRPMLKVEAAGIWSYSVAAWRQANGNTANWLDFVIGLDAEPVTADVVGSVSAVGSGGGGTAGQKVSVGVGIGLNSSTVNSASPAALQGIEAVAGSDVFITVRAHYQGFTGIGRHTLRWLEIGDPAPLYTPGAFEDWRGTTATSACGISGNVYA
jgi:hypothetical protein